MTMDIDKIFTPSCGVDLVFNLNSLTPFSRSSIIYDADHDNQSIVVAQPHIKITQSTAFKDLYLTSIIHANNRKIRLGVVCTIKSFIDDYSLANKSKTGAIVLQYEPPLKEANIRAAFRLSLSAKFTVKGKMIYQNLDFFTPTDFNIRDISLNGIGIVIPKNTSQLQIIRDFNIKDELELALILVNQEESRPVGTVPVTAKIARINKNYSDSHVFIGCQFISITSETDSLLNSFIHAAQIEELRKISGI